MAKFVNQDHDKQRFNSRSQDQHTLVYNRTNNDGLHGLVCYTWPEKKDRSDNHNLTVSQKGLLISRK